MALTTKKRQNFLRTVSSSIEVDLGVLLMCSNLHCLPGSKVENKIPKAGGLECFRSDQCSAFSIQTCLKGSEYNIAAYLSHILNNRTILFKYVHAIYYFE